MTLTLELTASSAARPGDAQQRAFDEQGGTIGRAASNSWVLTHTKVSGHHAVITFRNGVFYIEDTSRNGVAVNSMENRLVRNRPYALKTGDRIFIEPYEIGVWIQGDAVASPGPRSDPFAEMDPFAAPGSGWPAAAATPEMPAQGDVVDPLLLIPGGAPPPRTGPPPPVPVDDVLAQHYQPPAVVQTPPPTPPPAAPVIPAGYNPLDDAFAEPVVAPRIPNPQSRSSAPIPVAPPRPPVPPVAAAPPPIAPPPPRPSVPPAPVAPLPPLADDPFADPSPHNLGGAAAAGPAPVAPLDLDALTGPPPDGPPSGTPIRPRPGMDAQARRRAKEPTVEESQTVRFPGSADSGSASASGAAPSAVRAAQSVPPARTGQAPEPEGPAASSPVAAPPAAPGLQPPAAQPIGAVAAPLSAAPADAIASAPASSAAAAPVSGGDLNALMVGAGLPGGTVTPELSRDIGRILRVVVEGLMDVLQSRQRIKEEFGMQQTVFRPQENNPLKFSANLDDALHNLFVKQNPAYLGSVDAFREAFDDLRDHQLAVLAGLRVAFDAMLAEFDPDRLQERFDSQIGKAALQLMPAKMRYWDMFRSLRADLAKDPETAFERLFGEEFRRAYDKQFRDLKAQRRTREGRSPSDPSPRS